ncbi:hypothetical protein GJ496_008988 [Pomphorhynchus laevis]|nr:hypothetical protein GJ496_008988 [Pomphorhynchus laevis]
MILRNLCILIVIPLTCMSYAITEDNDGRNIQDDNEINDNVHMYKLSIEKVKVKSENINETNVNGYGTGNLHNDEKKKNTVYEKYIKFKKEWANNINQNENANAGDEVYFKQTIIKEQPDQKDKNKETIHQSNEEGNMNTEDTGLEKLKTEKEKRKNLDVDAVPDNIGTLSNVAEHNISVEMKKVDNEDMGVDTTETTVDDMVISSESDTVTTSIASTSSNYVDSIVETTETAADSVVRSMESELFKTTASTVDSDLDAKVDNTRTTTDYTTTFTESNPVTSGVNKTNNDARRTFIFPPITLNDVLMSMQFEPETTIEDTASNLNVEKSTPTTTVDDVTVSTKSKPVKTPAGTSSNDVGTDRPVKVADDVGIATESEVIKNVSNKAVKTNIHVTTSDAKELDHVASTVYSASNLDVETSTPTTTVDVTLSTESELVTHPARTSSNGVYVNVNSLKTSSDDVTMSTWSKVVTSTPSTLNTNVDKTVDTTAKTIDVVTMPVESEPVTSIASTSGNEAMRTSSPATNVEVLSMSIKSEPVASHVNTTGNTEIGTSAHITTVDDMTISTVPVTTTASAASNEVDVIVHTTEATVDVIMPIGLENVTSTIITTSNESVRTCTPAALFNAATNMELEPVKSTVSTASNMDVSMSSPATTVNYVPMSTESAPVTSNLTTTSNDLLVRVNMTEATADYVIMLMESESETSTESASSNDVDVRVNITETIADNVTMSTTSDLVANTVSKVSNEDLDTSTPATDVEVDTMFMQSKHVISNASAAINDVDVRLNSTEVRVNSTETTADNVTMSTASDLVASNVSKASKEDVNTSTPATAVIDVTISMQSDLPVKVAPYTEDKVLSNIKKVNASSKPSDTVEKLTITNKLGPYENITLFEMDTSDKQCEQVKKQPNTYKVVDIDESNKAASTYKSLLEVLKSNLSEDDMHLILNWQNHNGEGYQCRCLRKNIIT